MHFLKKSELHGQHVLGKPRACVDVRFVDDALHVSDRIGVLKADALVVNLPERIQVLGTDGKPIKPTGTFMITVETFNPHHALVDVF